VTTRGRSALLWGAIGALAFLTLHGAYLLAGGTFLGTLPIAGVTTLVFGATAITSDYVERRLGRFDRRADERR
jgi:hypothetical protein